jgi:hypothetical protein
VKDFTRKYIREGVVSIDEWLVGKALKHGTQLGCRSGRYFTAPGKVFVAHLFGTNLGLGLDGQGKFLAACASCFCCEELHIKGYVMPDYGVGGLDHQVQDFKSLVYWNPVHLCKRCINPVDPLCGFGDLEAYWLDVCIKV